MFNLLRNRGHFTTTVVKRLNLLGNRRCQEAESPWKQRSFYDRRCQETVTFYFCITLVCLYFQ